MFDNTQISGSNPSEEQNKIESIIKEMYELVNQQAVQNLLPMSNFIQRGVYHDYGINFANLYASKYSQSTDSSSRYLASTNNHLEIYPVAYLKQTSQFFNNMTLNSNQSNSYQKLMIQKDLKICIPQAQPPDRLATTSI